MQMSLFFILFYLLLSSLQSHFKYPLQDLNRLLSYLFFDLAQELLLSLFLCLILRMNWIFQPMAELPNSGLRFGFCFPLILILGQFCIQVTNYYLSDSSTFLMFSNHPLNFENLSFFYLQLNCYSPKLSRNVISYYYQHLLSYLDWFFGYRYGKAVEIVCSRISLSQVRTDSFLKETLFEREVSWSSQSMQPEVFMKKSMKNYWKYALTAFCFVSMHYFRSVYQWSLYLQSAFSQLYQAKFSLLQQTLQKQAFYHKQFKPYSMKTLYQKQLTFSLMFSKKLEIMF